MKASINLINKKEKVNQPEGCCPAWMGEGKVDEETD
jgi:hypothetical protein